MLKSSIFGTFQEKLKVLKIFKIKNSEGIFSFLIFNFLNVWIIQWILPRCHLSCSWKYWRCWRKRTFRMLIRCQLSGNIWYVCLWKNTIWLLLMNGDGTAGIFPNYNDAPGAMHGFWPNVEIEFHRSGNGGMKKIISIYALWCVKESL